jgi:hypothetical protein
MRWRAAPQAGLAELRGNGKRRKVEAERQHVGSSTANERRSAFTLQRFCLRCKLS